MGAYLPLFVAIPLLGAALLIIIPRARFVSKCLLVGIPLTSLAFSIALLLEHAQTPVIAEQIGAWPAGIAIPFVSDTFSALMLATTSLLVLISALFAIASRDADERYFGPLVLVLSAGVSGALLTADLFNLFVFIELMFLPSCGLIIMRKGLRRLEAPRLYVSMNLITSAILVTGIGLVYAQTGTVNLAQLSGAAEESTMTAAAVGVIFIALGIKAAVFPVHGWLARTYPATSPVVTALFSGLHTKVAVYALYRIYAVMFEGAEKYLWLATAIFIVTMVVGAFGALGEKHLRSILAFHMVSQIGYILLGLALFGPLGIAAGIFYLIHHMIVKASLFFSAGAIEETYGSGDLKKLSGIARSNKVVAVAFFGAALSLAGIPPFSGFIAKYALLRAALDLSNIAAAIAIVAVSIITLMSMLKIWNTVFWDRPHLDDESNHENSDTKASSIKLALALPGLALALLSLFIGLNANVLMELSDRAAETLTNTQPYVEEVLSE